MRYLILLLLLAGCSSKYDECIDQERESYRSRNPNASHALINSKQRDFEMMCSSYLKK